MFKAPPTDNQFLFVTLSLVLLLGVPAFLNITQEDESLPEVAAVAGTAGLSTDRHPASIPAPAIKPPSKALEQTQWDLSCDKHASSVLRVSSDHVQFHGRTCLREGQGGEVEIINRTNGYTASIFFQGSNKYQTDLIQLQQGDNEIAIRYRERSGKMVEEVILVQLKRI